MTFLNARRTTRLTAMLLTVFFVIVVLVAVLLVWFYQENQKVDHPIMTKIDPVHSNAKKTPVYLAISPNHLHKTDRLITQFAMYHPDYEVVIATDDISADVALDGSFANKNLPSFNYAMLRQSSQPLTGYLLTDNASALLFRDFLLSSPAQDILIDENFDTIEPYRYLSHTYFDTNNTAIAPQSP